MAASVMVSCSSDDNINTAAATVGFKDGEVSVKESKGIFYVPIVVEGETNGAITLEIAAEDKTPDNCKEDVHYLITSKNIIIPKGKKEVNVEIRAVDDRVINPDREFNLSIKNVSGATTDDTRSIAKVTMRDNDDIPYERMAGTWIVEATNTSAEPEVDPETGVVTYPKIKWEMELEVEEDETSESYGSLIKAAPWAVWDGTVPIIDDLGNGLSHNMTFKHNASTGATTVDMRMGSIMADGLDFGTIEGVDMSNSSARSATDGMAGYSYNGTITGTVSEDFDKITFSQPFYIIVFTPGGQPFMNWGGFTDITFTIKNLLSRK